MNENVIIENLEPVSNIPNIDDENIKSLQINLIRMGFDIIMVNKIIYYFHINNENDAIDYLTKNDNGIWGHPFIPISNDNIPLADNNIANINNNLLSRPKDLMNDIFLKVNSFKKDNNTNNLTEETDIKNNKEICEICGESIDLHNSNNLINNLNINNSNSNGYNNNLIQDENITEEEINECPICLCEFENPIELETCKHKFCRECFNNYLVELIKKNQIDKIPCPLKNCNNKELKEEFFSQYLSEEEYFKYRTLKSNNEIARDPLKIFCPLCDSFAQISEEMKWKLDTNNLSYKKTTLTCQKGHNFCSCGLALHEGECYHTPKDFQKFLIKEKIKQCPKCGFLIKKNKGCNHMICGNPICKYEFCWICMKEAVPGHYKYGRCQGMQFTDPNSFPMRLKRFHPILYKILFMIIYRLIVYIIFFGILFFVPSFFVILVFGICMYNDAFNLDYKLNIIRFFHMMTGCCILIGLQSIFHCIVFSLLGLFIISKIFKIITNVFGNTIFNFR